MLLEPCRLLVTTVVEEIENKGLHLLFIDRLEASTQQVNQALPGEWHTQKDIETDMHEKTEENLHTQQPCRIDEVPILTLSCKGSPAKRSEAQGRDV